MIYIEYTEGGVAVSDFDYKTWLDRLKERLEEVKNISNYDIKLKVSTSIPITAVRLAICRNEINNGCIAFVYKDKIFQADKDGRIDDWPRGFADIDEDLSYDMLNLKRTMIEILPPTKRKT